MASISPLSAGRPAPAAEPIDRFVDFFEGLQQEDLARIDDIYVPDVHFVDPFSDFRGLTTLLGIFDAMFTKMKGYRLEVHEHGMYSADSGFVRWTMYGQVKALGPEPWVVEGCSMIRFAPDGRVREHVDYWDTASQMYERLPMLGFILRKLRERLAQH